MGVVSSSVFASRLVERGIADIACAPDDFNSVSLPVASLVIRHARNMEGVAVACHTDETQVMATDRPRAISLRICGVGVRYANARTTRDRALRVQRLDRQDADAEK